MKNFYMLLKIYKQKQVVMRHKLIQKRKKFRKNAKSCNSRKGNLLENSLRKQNKNSKKKIHKKNFGLKNMHKKIKN